MMAVDSYKNKAKVYVSDLCRFPQTPVCPLVQKEIMETVFFLDDIKNCIPLTKKIALLPNSTSL